MAPVEYGQRSKLAGLCQAEEGKPAVKRDYWSLDSGGREVKKRQVGKELETKLPQISKPLISKALGIGERNLYNQNTKRAEADLNLKDQILKVLEVNPAYGHRRIAIELGIGKKRVRRVMKLYGIKPYKRKARWTKKKDWGKPPSKYPNLIKGSCPLKPNIVFTGDFTRLIWNGKIIYLATFIDLFTREIVGWSISTKHTAELVIEAFLDAIRTGGKPLIVHMPIRVLNTTLRSMSSLWRL